MVLKNFLPLIAIMLFSLNVFSQRNTCVKKDSAIASDLNTLNKCVVIDKSNHQKVFLAPARNRIIRSLHEVEKEIAKNRDSAAIAARLKNEKIAVMQLDNLKSIKLNVVEAENILLAVESLKSPTLLGYECKDITDQQCFMSTLINELNSNFFYPKEAIAKDVQGTIHVGFKVDINGFISVRFMRVEGEKRDEKFKPLKEAIQLIFQKLPKFKPGYLPAEDNSMRLVNVISTVPIHFRLSSE